MEHTVKQGECLSSIAEQYGFFHETLWNHPANAALKKQRTDHNTLLPGDVVFVPDRRVKTVAAAHEQLHVFRLKSVPARVTLQLIDEDRPRANEPYLLEIDGQAFSGRTDGAGKLTQRIPPNARSGSLTVGVEPNRVVYRLKLGHLDPVTELSGLQGRLNNLGFFCGPVTGVFNEDTARALRAFQSWSGLTVSGELDAATIGKLRAHEEG